MSVILKSNGYKFIVIGLLFTLTITNLSGQDREHQGLDAITEKSVEAPLKFLASDWTEGRELGTKGAYIAADYIASVFQMYGVKPLGDIKQKRLSREYKLKGEKPESYRSYMQEFDLISEVRKSKSILEWSSSEGESTITKTLTEGSDYEIKGRAEAVKITAPVVFLGYGIKNRDLDCDPYKDVDLNGKIAFILTGFPGINNRESENFKVLNSSSLPINRVESEKIANAVKAGACAVMVYNPNIVFKASKPSNLPIYHDNEFYEGDKPQDDFYLKKIFLPNYNSSKSVPVIRLNKSIAESMLADYQELVVEIKDPSYKMSNFCSTELQGSKIDFKIDNTQKVVRVRNVLGYIEGEDTSEVVVIGGHYDHVGKYNGFTFNGADDNASGTVGVMTLARAFAESGKKPAKTIIFAAWTAEEQGLWGSKYFTQNIPDDMNITLNINMDMIGRSSIKDKSEAYLKMQYSEDFPNFEKVFKKINKENDLNLDIRYFPSKQPKGASDFVPFAAKGIPVISLFTGLHRDYHFPNDEVEFINLEKMTNIIKLSYLGLEELIDNKSK